MRESPAVAYSVVGAVLLLVVLWGPTPAFRNIWWILVFAVLLALGVTMLRRETALEFPGIEHGQALRDSRDAASPSPCPRTHAPPPPPATETRPANLGARPTAAPAARPGARRDTRATSRARDRGAITNDEYQAERARTTLAEWRRTAALHHVGLDERAEQCQLFRVPI